MYHRFPEPQTLDGSRGSAKSPEALDGTRFRLTFDAAACRLWWGEL